MTNKDNDVEVKWTGVLRTLLATYEKGTPSARIEAVEELYRMAETADAYVRAAKRAAEMKENDNG